MQTTAVKESNTHPSRLMAIAPEKSAHNDEIMFKVRDTTASVARTHVMLDDNKRPMNFTFPNDVDAVDVPYRYALKFARITSFEVTDPTGRVIRAIPQKKLDAGFHIDHDECVAKYDELTHEALLSRATNAGGAFKSKVTKSELIAFLMTMSGMRVCTREEAEKEEEAEKARAAEAAAASAAVGPADNLIAENSVELD